MTRDRVCPPPITDVPAADPVRARPTHRTGSEIVAQLAGGKPWWKLSAGDLLPWLETLPRAAKMDRSTNIHLIGVPCTAEVLAARDDLLPWNDLVRFLDLVRRGIGALDCRSVSSPTTDDVRICGSGPAAGMVLDVDVGGLIFPVEFRRDGLDRVRSDPQAAARDIIEQVAIIRGSPWLSDGDATMRIALETAAAGIGHGAAPLWLRMRPISCYHLPGYIMDAIYDASILVLSSTLDWQPVGLSSLYSSKKVLDFPKGRRRHQRKRAKRLTEMSRSNVIGKIDPVAMAAIRQHGYDPGEMLSYALAAARDTPGCRVPLHRGAHEEYLHYADGVLRASFSFGPFARGEGSGRFAGDRLTLPGVFPETLLAGSKGMPLSKFVDHPLLVEAGVCVASARNKDGALHLICRAGGGMWVTADGGILARRRRPARPTDGPASP